jgi:hypothetical protein
MAQAQEQKARKLTTHQKAVLIQVLRTFPDERVEIRHAPDADDALPYAQDFLAVFKAILWDVEGPQPDPNAPVGLTLIPGAGSGLPPCAEALRDALRIYAIETQVRQKDGRDAKPLSFMLIVGPRGVPRNEPREKN